MVPADSRRISRVPRYSGYCYASYGFAYRTITVYGRSFQSVPLAIVHAMPQSYNPRPAVTGRVWALPRSLFGLFPVRSPLLGESLLFSFPAGTKMFQFPALASRCAGWCPFRTPGCPIRISADQRLLAPPRGLSQLATSFIASESLGIHRTPLSISVIYFLPSANGRAYLQNLLFVR